MKLWCFDSPMFVKYYWGEMLINKTKVRCLEIVVCYKLLCCMRLWDSMSSLIYIYIYIYICIYIYISLYIYIYKLLLNCTAEITGICICIYSFICLHVYIYIHVYIYACTHVHVYAYTYCKRESPSRTLHGPTTLWAFHPSQGHVCVMIVLHTLLSFL